MSELPTVISYNIFPAVAADGSPTWELWRDWVLRFPPASGSKLLAMNADREVLERAIEHLTKKA